MKHNLKIAIVWEQLAWGGVDSYLKYLIEDWPNPNDEIIIYYNKNNAGAIRLLKQIEKLEYIKFISYNSIFIRKKTKNIIIRFFNYFFIPIFILTERKKFCKLFKLEKFDVLLSQNGGYPAAWGTLSAIFAAKKIGIPVRSLVIHHRANKPNVFQQTIRAILDKYIAKSVTSIIPVSYATKNSLNENTSLFEDEKYSNVRVIHNGVPNIYSKNISINLNTYIPLLNNELVIGILGRIESYKGHEDLIAAFSRLTIEEQLKIYIIIIGKGEEEEVERLKRYTKKLLNGNRIIFAGFIEENSQSIIKSLDLLVMTTRTFEGFGLTIAEAISVNVPVLATNVGAVSEFVNSNIIELIKPCDVRQLSLSIQDFINNNKRWKERADKAYEEFDHFSSKKMAIEYREHLLQNYLLEFS